MSIRNWSTTASSNNAAPPNGWPEGMAPSGVNNSARQLMADVRDTIENLPYFDYGHTATRVDADTFTVPTDLTAIYTVGRSLKIVGATTEYASVLSVSYSAPDTTVNVTGTVPTSLSTVSVGIVGAQAEYLRTPAEIAAGVTPTDYGFPNDDIDSVISANRITSLTDVAAVAAAREKCEIRHDGTEQNPADDGLLLTRTFTAGVKENIIAVGVSRFNLRKAGTAKAAGTVGIQFQRHNVQSWLADTEIRYFEKGLELLGCIGFAATRLVATGNKYGLYTQSDSTAGLASYDTTNSQFFGGSLNANETGAYIGYITQGLSFFGTNIERNTVAGVEIDSTPPAGGALNFYGTWMEENPIHFLFTEKPTSVLVSGAYLYGSGSTEVIDNAGSGTVYATFERCKLSGVNFDLDIFGGTFVDNDVASNVTFTATMPTAYQKDEWRGISVEVLAYEGTAAAGAASTITLDSGASASNDAYNTWQVEIVAGTGSGQTRTISDYVGSTKVATVSANWTTNPDATSEFRIYNTMLASRKIGNGRYSVSALGAPNDISLTDGSEWLDCQTFKKYLRVSSYWQPVRSALVDVRTNDFGSIAAGASATYGPFTVSGAAVGDFVSVAANTDMLGVTMSAYVSASNAVTLKVYNNTTGAVDLPSASFRFEVVKA